MIAPMLSVRNLDHAWPQGPLFQNLSFQAPCGLGWIVGDEGCGKSTLLALLAGALWPQRGECELQGVKLQENPAEYRKKVFWIDPQTEAHHHLSARAYWNGQQETMPAFKAGLIPTLVEALSLREHVEKPLYMLSNGSRRKVWWTAAIASGAPLVLMDQPFAALDAPSARTLREILLEISEDTDACWLLTGHERPTTEDGRLVLAL